MHYTHNHTCWSWPRAEPPFRRPPGLTWPLLAAAGCTAHTKSIRRFEITLKITVNFLCCQVASQPVGTREPPCDAQELPECLPHGTGSNADPGHSWPHTADRSVRKRAPNDLLGLWHTQDRPATPRHVGTLQFEPMQHHRVVVQNQIGLPPQCEALTHHRKVANGCQSGF